jgi:hypothetical protein
MTGQEALKIIDRLLEQHQRGTLKTLQAAIVSQVWKGDSYQTIGRELGYEPEYIKQVESQFEYVVWRSLQHAPTPKDLLDEILPILVGSQVQESSIALLMEQLRQKRCLLVLDNVESILQAGSKNGCYLAGYEAYGEIFQRVCDESHQSCMAITGREKPHGITVREGVNLPVRSIQLTGLSIVAAHHILIDKGLESRSS